MGERVGVLSWLILSCFSIFEVGLGFENFWVTEMAGNVEIPKRFLQRLMCDNEKAKDMLRETQIKEKVASISGPGPKRAVAHHMRSLFLLEDMSDVWTDFYEDKLELEKEAKEKGEVAKVPLVRADNLEEVAEALVRQEEFWTRMKEHIIYT